MKPGKYDLVLDPVAHLADHPRIGRPSDSNSTACSATRPTTPAPASPRSTSASNKFQYGSDNVNLFADKTQPGSLGAVGYDDEGVKTKRWDLIKDGMLVDYQAIRDQAHILGKNESRRLLLRRLLVERAVPAHGQRLAARRARTSSASADMIKDVENGIYIIGDGSFSIDQQRYNAQFGGQLFYEIKNGKITGMIEDVAYQIRTPEFWNACVGVCDESDYRLGGSFFDGKGQPGQVSAVSHGSSTARFNGINVINTARSLG